MNCPCGRTFDKANSFGLHSRYCEQATPAVRFWANVDKSPVHNGCWIFTGFIKWDGYGWLNRNGRNMTSHRYSWILEHGQPPEGAHILHTCDVPACCNPAHLRLGTHEENMADMKAKRRHTFGEKNHSAKINHEIAEQIRARFRKYGNRKNNSSELMEEFHVSRATILNIVSGRNWKIRQTAPAILHPNRVRPRRTA